ncbi:flagellar hook-basal body complex protein FliE [Marinicauda pacifica]|jgi:flagellar hook-basal body complex protein FliE|uniref:Flagellar hook-basal body complex protein FliE n=1 Tax=Marinicauda pacifica TaxID=1133559 RepID=A0A4S2HA18_9PROT|nr:MULTISPECIES: flagellar hook-basal body complex protein FliE [Marinicauda]TGY92750.1 flagellar hook-basal body complex protein FliE [Marinicauda pacifica]GGE40073.1 flagellar hook-basal body complex protein FliE [Marinicauda pacifica]
MDLAAIRAYAAAAQNATGAGSSNPLQGGEPSDRIDFGSMVMDAVGETEAAISTAENLTGQAATGQAELVDVVTAVAAAEVQLETVVAVRDQVIKAYQEILRMPI